MQLPSRKESGTPNNAASPGSLKSARTTRASSPSMAECSPRVLVDCGVAPTEQGAHGEHKSLEVSTDNSACKEPRRMLWGSILILSLLLLGFWDQLFPPSQMKDVVRSVHEGAGKPGDVAGSAELPAERCVEGEWKRDKGGESAPGDDPACQKGATQATPRPSEEHAGAAKPTPATPSVFSSLLGDWSSPVSSSPKSANVRRVVLALLILVCMYCFIQARDCSLVLPHPGFWRVVHGMCVVHLIVMVVLLVVDEETGRHALELLFPEIAGKREEIFAGTLVVDCRINASTIHRQLTSVWFVSHVVGWLVKMVILRHWGFCLIYSLCFELGELSFHWLVPELCECWWDSIFIDALLSNVCGMFLGVLFMKLVNLCQYDWLGRYPQDQNVSISLTPFASEASDWSFYKTPRHLFMSIVLLMICLFSELNVFFLMAALDIPAAHYSNPLRTLYIALLGVAAAAEHYEFTTNRRDRIGRNKWLLIIILFVEWLVCAKYGARRYAAGLPPPDIFVPWIVSSILFSLWCYCYYTTADLRTDSGKGKLLAKSPGGKGAGDESANLAAESKMTKRSAKQCPAASWQDRIKLLVLTLPPQACFMPLLYLSKFYFFDYVKIERSQ
ncbi:putative phosphatidylserine synthase [Toxoplasma gondii RUB]|uniref:Putative phosphatidylserine synthase n=2 Tax=Toxoplasma gondii TaxID=5811 RepID=A0A086M553_TOXGO|nr:putative phosphatidylserine synthase [Toxoplasma gondii p89]KFG64021.1 putative phosphatidylserine synthase [Toxoplasma gondii RUB]